MQADNFVDLLIRHQPDILHFAGHGDAGQTLTLLKNGNEALLSVHDFSVILQRLPVAPQLVVLNACFAASFASALVPHVSVVVGADGSIGDRAARLFSRTFYSVLSRSQSVAAAFELSRAQIRLGGYDDAKLGWDHSRLVDPETLVFFSHPELMGALKLDKGKNPIRTGGDYNIDLWLRGVSQNVDLVTYQVCHESFKGKHQFWEVKRETSQEFWTDDFASYGDVTIRIVAWSKERGIGIELRLSRALRRHYGSSPSPRIAKALGDVELN